jgi:hypothetical protein
MRSDQPPRTEQSGWGFWERGSGWRVYLLLWGSAAVVRLIYVAVARPEFTIYYWDAANSLLDDGTLSTGGVRTALLEPLYPIFLAALRFGFGDRPLLVQAAQALVASAGVVYLYRLTLTLTGNLRTALAAAALFAVYPLLVRHAVDGTESALLTTLLIGFAYQFIAVRSVGGAAAAGVWLGLAIVTRAVVLPLLILAPLLLALTNTRPKTAFALAGAALLVAAPAGIRNHSLNGSILPVRMGLNLFKSNCEYASGIVAEYGADMLLAYAESRLDAQGLLHLPETPELEQRQDAAYRAMAVAEVRRHPIDTLRLKVRNVLDFFSPVLVPRRISTAATTLELGEDGQSVVTQTVNRPLADRLAYTISYSVVLVLAGFGIHARRRRVSDDAILWCILLTFTLVYAVFSPATRYRVPVEFVLLFFAATGVAALAGDGAVTRRRRSIEFAGTTRGRPAQSA